MGDRPAERQTVELRAVAAPGTRRVYWFVDGALLATAGPGEPVRWPLASGRHSIRAADDRGRGSSVTISVRAPSPFFSNEQ